MSWFRQLVPPEVVRAVRRWNDASIPKPGYRAVARQHGISPHQVRRIIDGMAYRHVK